MASEPRYYHDIETVKSLQDVAEVNAHLKVGWELLKIADVATTIAESDVVRTQTVLVYIVGLRKGAYRPQDAPTPAVSHPPTAPRGPTPTSSTDAPTTRACKFCGAPMFMAKEGERWLPKNPDGTPHRCNK